MAPNTERAAVLPADARAAAPRRAPRARRCCRARGSWLRWPRAGSGRAAAAPGLAGARPSSPISDVVRSPGGFCSHTVDAAFIPSTLPPYGARVKYASRMSVLLQWSSRRSAYSICRTLVPSDRLRRSGRSNRATCMVSEEAPETTRPLGHHGERGARDRQRIDAEVR